MKIIWSMVCGAALLPCGCSSGGPSAIAVPVIDAEAAAKAALAEYDANGDGFLDKEELAQCPALLAALEFFDKNKDDQLSREEIAERLKTYLDGNAGLIEVGCEVMLDGLPLSGATVTLVPEKFLGPNIKPATGVSDAQGRVRLQTEGYDLPGVNFGLFKIEVSLQSSGQETIRERYNAKTTLGCEVAVDRIGRSEGIRLHLGSRIED